MADKSATASHPAKSAPKTNEAHDETAAAVPAGTRDVNLQDSTPSGPVQTPPREVTPSSRSAASVRMEKLKDDTEPKMKVVLKARIPTLGLKVGDEANLPESYAKRLLAGGDALLPEDAAALAKADDIRAKADAQAAQAAQAADAQRQKARKAEHEAAADARAVIEDRQAKVDAKASAQRKTK